MASGRNPSENPTPGPDAPRETGEEGAFFASSPGSSAPAQPEDIQNAAAEYFGRLTATAHQLADQARDLYATSEAFAGRHPTGLIASAAAVGVVFGIMLGRR